MKYPATRLLAGLALIFLSAAVAPLVAQPVVCPPDKALISADNPAYADALELRQLLEKNNFTVQCIFPTKLSSMFMVDKNGILQSTVEGEACFSTNYGGLDVIFVPKPQTFSEFEITERRKERGYLYRFSGTPHIASEGKFNFGTAARQYFLKPGNCLVIVSDTKLLARLQAVFSQTAKP